MNCKPRARTVREKANCCGSVWPRSRPRSQLHRQDSRTGDLRIGRKSGLVEEAIAAAFGAAELEAVRVAQMFTGDLNVVALAAQGRLEAEPAFVPS